MSQANVDLVAGLYAAAEKFLPTPEGAAAAAAALEDPEEVARRVQAVGELLGYMDEDIEWQMIWEPVPFRGHDGVIQAFGQWMEIMDQWHWVSYDFTDAGDTVIVDVTTEQRGKASGAVTRQRLFLNYEIRNGKIVRVREFDDRDEAFGAASLA